MSLNIGDNFKYLGKKFLDDRQSFNTLAELMACTAVPEGFIAYCVEDKKRYEFVDNNWIEYRENGNIENVIINEDDVRNAVFYIGDEEPEDTSKLWLDPSNNTPSSDITMDNPVIQELFACIRTLQNQVKDLQAEVEYLKINGGGNGGGIITPPGPGDDEEQYEEICLELEEGGLFLLEEGGFIILEESDVIPKPEPIIDSILILEDGGSLLMEDGSFFLLETSIPIISTEKVLLLESGANVLLESGGKILVE